jgi:two-component system sensor histidine kinase VicK
LVEAGAISTNPKFSLNHIFPRPFAFLSAHLTCDHIPRSPGRQTLNIMMTIMALVILMGLFAIYRSVYAIVGMSERRSQFVSSVTHELKTPLTNIRMYIEMLEQGIAPSPERERDYFRILGSESSRLSRLINNVLEYSRLEKKNRQLDLSEGNFEEVIAEVQTIMSEKLRQEGFVFQVQHPGHISFRYDREVMVQVLINLIENSMKFSKNSGEKIITLALVSEDESVKISLSDTGPGIPKHALKKVFDDFFRVDNELTRTTGGTGIGLALVSKFANAMGGRVEAKNNKGPGCTITICLPLAKKRK